MDELELYILLNYLKNLLSSLKEQDNETYELTLKQIAYVIEYHIELLKNDL